MFTFLCATKWELPPAHAPARPRARASQSSFSTSILLPANTLHVCAKTEHFVKCCVFILFQPKTETTKNGNRYTKFTEWECAHAYTQWQNGASTTIKKAVENYGVRAWVFPKNFNVAFCMCGFFLHSFPHSDASTSFGSVKLCGILHTFVYPRFQI